jgi:hypothetical protein
VKSTSEWAGWDEGCHGDGSVRCEEEERIRLVYVVEVGEFVEARGWVRYFRVGKRSGILGLGIIAVWPGAIGVGILAENWGGSVVHNVLIAMTALAVACVGPLGVGLMLWRALGWRSRHVIAEGQWEIEVEMGDLGMDIFSGPERVHWSWDEATWMESLEHVWVVSTWERHLVIPKRVTAGVAGFEERLQMWLRKRSGGTGFEVQVGGDGT